MVGEWTQHGQPCTYCFCHSSMRFLYVSTWKNDTAAILTPATCYLHDVETRLLILVGRKWVSWCIVGNQNLLINKYSFCKKPQLHTYLHDQTQPQTHTCTTFLSFLAWYSSFSILKVCSRIENYWEFYNNKNNCGPWILNKILAQVHWQLWCIGRSVAVVAWCAPSC